VAFGWAYIDCADSGSGGQAAGPPGAVQFLTGSNATSGTLNLMFHTAAYGVYAANTLILTGTLVIDGTVSASHYHVKNVTEIDSSGSTFFGDSDGDIHIRTGSMYVGTASAGNILEVNTSTNQVKVLGFAGTYTRVTDATGITSSNNSYIYGISAAGNVDFRLHNASIANSGGIYVIKDEVSGRTGEIEIRTFVDGQTIDGAATYQLSGSYPAISLYSNGANWFVF